MYKEYTVNYHGEEVLLYVKSELQESYNKISNNFINAKLMLADYAIKIKTGEVIKDIDNASDTIKNLQKLH